ncbi:MAG: MOSC domain-containing protein, partial [Pseudomonadota bacterium]|nr:MOSC domain-containing protein [Pseudomonadota bacterium]
GEESGRWLSQAIGDDCRLVFIPDDEIRPCDPRYAAPGDRTSFTDGFPLLLISQASLDDLNRRLAQPVEMRRFRPNLVVAGVEPYAEDNWQRIRVGEIEMRGVKPCSRCAIPAVDPDTGIVSGLEPLRTLSAYRKRNNKIYFGQNLAHNGHGSLCVGDLVTKLE